MCSEEHLRICFAIYHRCGGGAERALTELAGTLADMGHTVMVIQKVGSEQDYPINGKVMVAVLEQMAFQKSRLKRFQTFYRKVRELDPDVLVPYLPWAELLCFCAAKLGRIGLIFTVRCNPAVYPERLAERLLRNVMCFFSNGLYVQNMAQCEYFPAFMRKNMFVLPNIVRKEFFEAVRVRGKEITNFVNAGRLVPQKNQQMLIRAFAGVVRRFPGKHLCLRIYGDGPLRDELVGMIGQLGMQEHIFMEGFSMDLPAEYVKADAFVLSSDFEGQPNVLMEAMAAGLPCVSTDCPTGPAELIDSEINGVLIPCGDEEQLRLALERFVADPSFADRMGRAARKRMEEICDRERIGRAFADRCASAIGRRTAPRDAG